MKQLIGSLILALTLFTAPAALAGTRAEEAQKLALANRFITLIQGDQMGASLGQMTSALMPENHGMSPEEAARFREAMSEVTASMTARVFEAMAPIYADIFTLQELQALVDFYDSDLGRSMMQKTYAASPRMAAEMQAIMPELMADMGAQLCDRLDCTPEQRREMKVGMSAGIGAGSGAPTQDAPVVVSY